MSFKYPLVFLIIALSLIVSLACPTQAHADDGVPPIDPTPEAISTDALPPGSTGVVVPTELPATDSTPSVVETNAMSTEGPLTISVTETVQTMSNAGVVLVDANSQPIPLVSEQAAELLNDPDPYIIRGGVTYSFTAGDCDPLAVGAQPCSNPIQQAINFSVNGETIFIDPGTYVEQLDISKNIVLQSTAPGAIIKSPTLLTGFFLSGSNHNYPIVYVHDTANASIIDFTIDGNGQGDGNYRFDGIGYYNAGGTIQGNTIENITNSTFSGAQSGVGIFVYATDGGPHTVNVDGNVVENYQKNGMTVSGNGIMANITNNMVTGAGTTTVIAQNGIQVSSGASALIEGNTISGNDYGNAANASTGILLFSAGNVDVQDNLSTKNDVDLYVLGGGNVDIHGNTFSNSDDDGVFIDGTSSNVSVTANTFTGNVEGLGSNSNVDLSKLTVTNNVFVGNGIGITNYSSTTILDATGNYWGCPDGPDSLLCDQVSKFVIYDPHLTKNPLTQTPVVTQNDSKSRQSSNSVLIPVTGSELTKISCVQDPVVMSVGGIQITFMGLCGYDVLLSDLKLETLPAILDTNEIFQFGLAINLFKDGALVDKLPVNASIEISFPALGLAKEWNSELNEWQDVPVSEVEGRTEIDAHSGAFVLIGK